MEDRGVPNLITLGFVMVFSLMGIVALAAVAFVLSGVVS